MSEEITRKIDAEAKRHYPTTNIEIFDPQTINAERVRELEQGIRRSIFSNGAEFGYQLAQEEIQRLTKEVDRWKASAIKWQKLYGNEKTNNA